MVRRDIKTIDDVKSRIKTLSLEDSQRSEILSLVDEFEIQVNKGKSGDKLRKIMVKVGSINISAGAVLFDYSENSGLLSRMVS